MYSATCEFREAEYELYVIFSQKMHRTRVRRIESVGSKRRKDCTN